MVPGNTDTGTDDTNTGTDDTDTGNEETTLAVETPDTGIGDTDCDTLLTVLTQTVLTDGEVSDTPAEQDA